MQQGFLHISVIKFEIFKNTSSKFVATDTNSEFVLKYGTMRCTFTKYVWLQNEQKMYNTPMCTISNRTVGFIRYKRVFTGPL